MGKVKDFDTKKVDYNKIQVNFNEIIKKLHLVAKDFAEKKHQDISLENLAFEAKEQNFIGGGNKCIMMVDKSGNAIPESKKKEYLDCVKTYVHYFVGEEEEKYVEEKNLYPITDAQRAPQELSATSTGDEERATASKLAAMTKKEKAAATGTTSESYDYTPHDKLLNMLFEADGESTTGSTPESPTATPPTAGTPPEGGSGKAEAEGKDGDEKGTMTIGYSVPYNISVEGKKDSSLLDSIKGKMRGLFGGVLADLRNIKIKVGGVPVQIGKVLDWDKWREAAGYMGIDIKQVPQNIKQAFDTDFPNNNVNTSSIKVWGKSPLITQLNRQQKLSPDIKAKISNADYSVVIGVDSGDPNYPDYTTKSIAKTVTKAFGTADNLTNRNKVTEKDVIKIDDITDIYKKKSEYDKPNAKDMKPSPLSTDSTSTSKENPTKKTTVTEDQNEKEETSDDVNNGNNKNEKKDPRLEIIQSDEYKNEINSNLTIQNDKILKKLGENVDTQFKTNDECVEFLNAQDLNDAEFIGKVKKTKQNCLVTSITKDFGKTLKESGDIIKSLLRKYDLDNGLIVESEEEKSDREVTDETIDKQNPFQDANLDKEYHANAKKRVDSQDALLNTIQKMSGEVQKAFKNVFLSTKDKFEELKDIEPQFNMYQTNIELEKDSKTNESLDMVYNSKLLDMLFEGEGQNSPWNANLDSERLEIINCALIGGVSRISHWYEKDDAEQEDKNKEGEKQDQVKESENTGRRDKPEPKEGERDESTYNEAPQKNFGSRQHITPYCVVSETENVINYMKNHNIGSDSEYGKMRGSLNEAKNPERLRDAEGEHNAENEKNQYKYCAIVIKKHALVKDGKVQVFGGAGHESLDDQSVQKMLDSIIGHNADVGEDYKVGMIHCEDQNEKTMNAQKGELLEQNLAYHNEKGKGLVPVLDVWVRPFNLKDKDSDKNPEKPEGDKFNILLVQMQQMINQISIQNNIKVVVGGGDGGTNPIPPSLDIKMKFIFVMPDPIVIVITGEDGVPPPPPKPKPQEDGDKKNNKNKTKSDWYIIPHEELKDMKERPHQETHYSDGTTMTKTSNAEYKP